MANEQEYQQKIDKIEKELARLKNTDQEKNQKIEGDIFSLQSTVATLSKSAKNKKDKTQDIFIPLLRAVAYTLLILTFIDYANIFINFVPFNPEIELQTIAILVNNSPSALIGIALLFYEKEDSNSIEKIWLKFVSWMCLIVGIGYLLLIPVGISASFMLDTMTTKQVNNAVSQQKQPLENLKEKLNQARSDQEILKILQNPNNKQAPKIGNVQEFKKQAIANIIKAEDNINQQSAAQRQQQKISLLKNSVRYILGCLVCGIFFIYIWSSSRQINQFLG
ncbi:MAG TPA: HpsJ family protein [Allocoleopsis sp.]